MKMIIVSPRSEPKSKEAALNLYVQWSSVDEGNRRREENLLKQKTQLEKKLQRLQEELEKIKDELNGINHTTNRSFLEQLQTRWALTEAEILETKSALLRKTITDKQRSLLELEKKGEFLSTQSPEEEGI